MLKSRKKLKLSESNLTPEKDNAQAYVFDEKEYINKKKEAENLSLQNENKDGNFETEIVDDKHDFEFEHIESPASETEQADIEDITDGSDDDIDDKGKVRHFKTKVKRKNENSKKKIVTIDNDDEDDIDDESELKDNKRKTKGIVKTKNKHKLSKPKKVIKAIGITLVVLGILVGLYIGVNNLLALIKNQHAGTQDNFSNEEIIDNNNNDLVFDDNGQIIIDPITDTEKEILVNSLISKVITDANKRLELPITTIDDIKLISLLPSNDCIGLDPENPSNLYDKYFLTILFSSQGQTYQMSYLTGDEFQMELDDSDKNNFSDFVQFLQSSCAIDNCQVLETNLSSSSSNDVTQSKADILSSLGVNGFVGDVYYAFTQIGDLCYNIPIYTQNEDGLISVSVYSCLAQYIDNYELDPIETLSKELKGESLPPLPEGQEKYFMKTDVANKSSFDHILNLYNQFKNPAPDSEIER